MREVLVVANQTLASHDLRATLTQRVQGREVKVWVVVPATPVPEQPHDSPLLQGTGVVADFSGPYPSEEAAASEPDAFAVAENRLRRGIDLIRELGCSVEGEVGDPHPMQAVEDFLARHAVDEVIVSTLPTHLSRWLRMDLPSRVERKYHLPVTTVTGQAVVPAP